MGKVFFWKPQENILYKNKKTQKWIIGDGYHHDDTLTEVIYIKNKGNEQKASFIIEDNICSIKIGKKYIETDIKDLKFEKYYKIKWLGPKQLGVGSRFRNWKYIVKER
jgi:hypothetical protein